jgi:hypothetical protein
MPASILLKSALNNAGYHIPKSAVRRLESALNYLYVARWMKDHDFSPAHTLRARRDLIAMIAGMICDDEVLYLEFGVHKGAAIRQWSELLRNKATRLHGFDSFEGLPEQWDDHSGHFLPRGYFSTQGVIPQIPDSRVKFFKGWFQNTLPKYEFIDSPVTVIFLDADLYSSTSFVLKTLKPHIKIGTIVYFDEFWDRYHEMKAFDEFLNETGMHFELLAVANGMRCVAFRRIG